MTLGRDAITDAAMAVLDEVGFDKLSMRAVADRLGVQVGGLYYHLPDKRSLLRAMADRICERALDYLPDVPPATGAAASEVIGWQAEADVLCRAVRQAMLSCRDGARLLLEGPLLGSTGALEVMERLLTSLGKSGLPEGLVRVGADALMSYVTGFVLQEQLELSMTPPVPEDVAGFSQRFPLVFGAGGDVGGMSGHELFQSSINLVLTGLSIQATAVVALPPR